MNPFGPIPAVPGSRRIDMATGHPVEETKAVNNLPPQLPSAQQMQLAIRQGEIEAQRQRESHEGQDEWEAASWVRGRSVTRCLIELAMRVAKLEKGRD